MPVGRTLFRDLGRMLSRSRTAEWRAASYFLGFEVESRRGESLAPVTIWMVSLGSRRGAQHLRAVVVAAAVALPWLVLKKATPSDWNRRYRSSLREGTAGCIDERIPNWDFTVFD